MKTKADAKWALLIPVTCFLALLGSWVYRVGTLSNFGSHPPINASVPSVLQPPAARAADGSAKMTILIGLKARNGDKLDQLILDQHNPKSPQYGHFLTTEEFTERFGQTPARIDAVKSYLTAHGITVDEVLKNNLLILASGTVQQLESVFQVKIIEIPTTPGMNLQSMQSHQSVDKPAYTTDKEPTIPAELSDVVESVIGLDARPLHKHIDYVEKPQHAEAPAGSAPDQPPAAGSPPDQPPTAGSPPAQPPPTGAPTGQPAPVATPPGTTPPVPVQPALSPQQVATVYNFPNINNKNVAHRKYSGKGVNLAIATAEGYDPKEVETYWQTTGVTRTGTLSDVYVGPKSSPGDETTLDVELAGAQAPGANIYVWQGAAPALIFFAITYARVVVDNNADIMTSSWGLCEDVTGQRQIATEELIMREAAVQGIAVFFSAGDDGAYDCASKDQKPNPAVDFPASSPFVTAVGGTSLWIKNDARTDETAWRKGGGGVSKVFEQPLFQVAPTLPPGNMRATADVSLDADPHTGYMYLFKGKWENIGGTSAAAPTWAAFWTLVLQATGQRVGSANFYVYRMGGLKEYNNLFFDVTTGDNGKGLGPGFNAGPGWDIPTGWGTPDGLAITKWMVSASPAKAPEDRQLGQKHPASKSK